MRLVTSAEMRAIEAAADAAGLSYAEMMRRAGRAVAEAADRRLAELADRRLAEAVDRLPAGGQVVVLVGPGNNGGDGLVAADGLLARGHGVRLVVWKRSRQDDPLMAPLSAHGPVSLVQLGEPGAIERAVAWLGEADLVVDALLGTGANRPIEGDLAGLLGALAAARAAPRPPFLLAVDLPTGLDADSGSLDPCTVPADLTLTFGYPKRGQLRFPGAGALGRLCLDDLGIPAVLGHGAAAPTHAQGVISSGEVAAWLPPRPMDAHKGSFGRVLVVAGSRPYPGAASLAAEAAYRAGAGLVCLAAPASLQPILAGRLPEATHLPLAESEGALAEPAAAQLRTAWGGYQCLLLGPGLSAGPGALAFLRALLDTEGGTAPPGGEADGVESGTGGASPPPAAWLVDADGLNLLARIPDWPRRLPPATVLTPHPGEMARLTGLDRAAIAREREGLARRYAAEWGRVLVLKGAFTVVAAPDGRLLLAPFATAALARAGTGDVLAGLIAGLLAQGLPPFEAAAAGCYLHGLAGELLEEALGRRAPIAGDLLERIAPAFARIEDGGREGI